MYRTDQIAEGCIPLVPIAAAQCPLPTVSCPVAALYSLASHLPVLLSPPCPTLSSLSRPPLLVLPSPPCPALSSLSYPLLPVLPSPPCPTLSSLSRPLLLVLPSPPCPALPSLSWPLLPVRPIHPFPALSYLSCSLPPFLSSPPFPVLSSLLTSLSCPPCLDLLVQTSMSCPLPPVFSLSCLFLIPSSPYPVLLVLSSKFFRRNFAKFLQAKYRLIRGTKFHKISRDLGWILLKFLISRNRIPKFRGHPTLEWRHQSLALVLI